jgi:hypothetical protein
MSDDVDAETLISRLSGPLAPPDRAAFRRAAEAALAHVPCLGEGAAYRALAQLQRRYFTPPTEQKASWGIENELHTLGRSKLATRPPIAEDIDGRILRYRKPLQAV